VKAAPVVAPVVALVILSFSFVEDCSTVTVVVVSVFLGVIVVLVVVVSVVVPVVVVSVVVVVVVVSVYVVVVAPLFVVVVEVVVATVGIIVVVVSLKAPTLDCCSNSVIVVPPAILVTPSEDELAEADPGGGKVMVVLKVVGTLQWQLSPSSITSLIFIPGSFSHLLMYMLSSVGV